VATLLEEAVSRGRLTQAQADEITAGLDEAINTMLTTTYEEARGGVVRRLVGLGVESALLDAAVQATGLTRAELREQLAAEGATLASVITANGATVEDVVSAAKTAITERVTAAVADGRLTQESADALLAGVDAALETAVNSSGADLRFGGRRGRR
jgi:predicted RNase H-like HicB family nuclease